MAVEEPKGTADEMVLYLLDQLVTCLQLRERNAGKAIKVSQ
jgi:hypothetical protein